MTSRMSSNHWPGPSWFTLRALKVQDVLTEWVGLTWLAWTTTLGSPDLVHIGRGHEVKGGL